MSSSATRAARKFDERIRKKRAENLQRIGANKRYRENQRNTRVQRREGDRNNNTLRLTNRKIIDDDNSSKSASETTKIRSLMERIRIKHSEVWGRAKVRMEQIRPVASKYDGRETKKR